MNLVRYSSKITQTVFGEIDQLEMRIKKLEEQVALLIGDTK